MIRYKIQTMVLGIAFLMGTFGAYSVIGEESLFSDDKASKGLFPHESFHAIWVFDTDAEGIGEGVKFDLAAMTEVFKEIFKGHEHRFRLTLLQGSEVTPDNIRRALQSLENDPTEARFFYYSGHGAFDEDRGHLLATSGGYIYREEVRKMLLEKQGGKTSLITDSCANFVRLTQDQDKAMSGLFSRNRPAKWKGFKEAFLTSPVIGAFTDINSSSPGEFSWSNDVTGGFFTRAFIYNLCRDYNDLDRDKSGYVALSEFFQCTKETTDAIFQQAKDRAPKTAEIKNTDAQTARSFYLSATVRLDRKRFKVINETGEPLRIRFMAWSTSSEKWHTPVGDKPYFEYEIADGEELILGYRDVEHQKTYAFITDRVRVWAIGMHSGSVWDGHRNNVLRIVPEEGYPIEPHEGLSDDTLWHIYPLRFSR